MTTIDPTPLAEQIAREHARVTGLGECLCGAKGIGFEAGYAEHIATVTERAVRERVAAEIEEFEPKDRALVHMPDWREAIYDAARIARGAPDA